MDISRYKDGMLVKFLLYKVPVIFYVFCFKNFSQGFLCNSSFFPDKRQMYAFERTEQILCEKLKFFAEVYL